MAPSRPGPREPSVTRRAAVRAASGNLAAGLLALLAGCLCPPRAEALLEVGFRTPVQALATYQTYLRMDLPAREYLCFSSGFRERNDLSAATYGEGRERLFRQKPWLKLFAKAQVVAERAVDGDRHWIDVRVLGRTIRVKLVREAFFEIFSGAELAADAYADFDALVAVAPAASGASLSVRLPVRAPPAALAGVTEVTVARHWKIDDLAEVAEPDPPAAPAP